MNSYRNSRIDNNTNESNNPNSSPLNKTSELNNAYRELYNSIDGKIDSDLTKFLYNNNGELNLNLADNNTKKNSNKKDYKSKSIFNERSITPNNYIKNYQNYNTFDYLYYESENLGKKNKKKQELNFKKIILLNHVYHLLQKK